MGSKKILSSILVCTMLIVHMMLPMQSWANPLAISTSVGTVDSVLIGTSNDEVVITGVVPQEVLDVPTSQLQVFELPIYEDALIVDYSTLTAIASEDVSNVVGGDGAFSIIIPIANLSTQQSLYSQFVVVWSEDTDTHSLVDMPKYITNLEVIAEHQYDYTSTNSIKGLHVMSPTDAAILGNQHATINLPYTDLLTLSDHGAESITYTYNGENYYFKKGYVEELDNQIRSMTENGMAVSAVILAQKVEMDNPDSPNQFIVHPDTDNNGLAYAFNLTDDKGVSYYSAITSFLTDRYSRGDKEYGRLMGFIVGHQIGQYELWNNMGPEGNDIDEYMKQYERTLRLTHNIVKSISANSRVYVSIDHISYSNYDSGQYSRWDILTKLDEYSNQGGNYNWSVLIHPMMYSGPTYYGHEINNWTTFDTLGSFVEDLHQYYLYDGQHRRIMVSGQGIDNASMSNKNLLEQAADYAYAYYKVLSLKDDIDAFIMHRQVDHADEGGLNLGLWTNYDDNISEMGKKKPIYEVFQNIDTVDSLDVTEFALKVLNIDSWEELVTGFDSNLLENRSTTFKAPSGLTTDAQEVFMISDFSDELTEQEVWKASDNTSNITIFDGMLTAPVLGYHLFEYKGVTRVFDTPQDWTASPYLNIKLQATGIHAEYTEYMVRVHGEDDQGKEYIAESSVMGNTVELSEVSVDLSQFAGVSNVSHVKLWARPNSDEKWTNGALQINELKLVEPTNHLHNISVEIKDHDDINIREANQPVQIIVRNKGNMSFTEEMAVSGEGPVTFDQDSFAVDLAPGEAQTYNLFVTSINTDNPLESHHLNVELDEKTYRAKLEVSNELYYDDNALVLGDFEDGKRNYWDMDQNVIESESKTEYASVPNPKVGNHMLVSTRLPVSPSELSTVTRTFANPLDLSQHNYIGYYITSYGGVGDHYYTKLLITLSDGQTVEREAEINSDIWNKIEFDISDIVDRDKITALSIGHYVEGVTTDWMVWAGVFSIDEVRAYPAAAMESIAFNRSSEELYLKGGKIQLLVKGELDDNTNADVSASITGTIYSGYDNTMITVSEDGLVNPLRVGTTTVTATNQGYTDQVEIIVSAKQVSLFDFETDIEGWEIVTDDGIDSIGSIRTQGGVNPIAYIPESVSGSRLLEVKLINDPSVEKRIRVMFDEPQDYSNLETIVFNMARWGGLTPTDRVEYEAHIVLTSARDAEFEETISITSEDWKDYRIEIGDWEFANEVKYIEIGFVTRNTDIPAWNGKFFVDHISGIEKAETDAALQNLSTSNGVLQPTFFADVLDYEVTVSNQVSRLNVTATAAGDHATLTINGESVASGAASKDIVLPVGTSSIQIQVTAQNGLVQHYTIAVTRQGATIVPPKTTPAPTAPDQPDNDVEEPVIPNPAEIKFTDVDGHWAEEAIYRAVGLEFVSGYPDATFKPNQQVTRQEFAVMIVNLLNLKTEGIHLPFTDVATIPDWSKNAISTAFEASIIKGYTDGSFRPNAIISREEMTLMLANAAGYANLESKSTDFADDLSISSWANGAVSLMREMGMVRGKLNNYFDPKGSATRAEAVIVLLNLYDYNSKL